MNPFERLRENTRKEYSEILERVMQLEAQSETIDMLSICQEQEHSWYISEDSLSDFTQFYQLILKCSKCHSVVHFTGQPMVSAIVNGTLIPLNTLFVEEEE